MSAYFRPIINTDAYRSISALTLAGGRLWFDHVERLSRDGASEILPVTALPEFWKERLCVPRPPITGVAMDAPSIMGILNVTPDSFSDGGEFQSTDLAVLKAKELAEAGANFIDIGGESTRPGALEIPSKEEICRIEPVIKELRGINSVISVDTRKADVAEVALASGAKLVNDVSGFQFDPKLLLLCAAQSVPVCVMHSKGLPNTMQNNPSYADVVEEVAGFLAGRISTCVASGVMADQIAIDPGFGFGKSLKHNLHLLRCLEQVRFEQHPLLVGLSRKSMLGTITGKPVEERDTASVVAAVLAAQNGADIIRVHDVAKTTDGLQVLKHVAPPS